MRRTLTKLFVFLVTLVSPHLGLLIHLFFALYSVAQTLLTITRRMKATVHEAIVSRGSPAAAALDFRTELRKRDAEHEILKRENFDLRLKIHEFQRAQKIAEEPRRISKSPGPDDFYGYSDDEGSRDQSQDLSTDLDHQDPVVSTLKMKLEELRAENDELVARNNDLSDALVDLEEKSEREAKAAEQKRKIDEKKAEQTLRAAYAQVQGYINQIEDMQSEDLKSKAERTQVNESLELAQRELKLAAERRTELEEKESELVARTEGLQMQVRANVEALEEQRKMTATAQEKVGTTTIELLRETKLSEEATAAAKKAEEQVTEKKHELIQIRKELESVRIERDSARARLTAEKDRAKLWRDAGDFEQPKDMLLSGASSAMNDLVLLLQRQREAYERSDDYQPKWREQVLGDMNQCLFALYRSQRELEAEREKFVGTYCHSDATLSGSLHTVGQELSTS